MKVEEMIAKYMKIQEEASNRWKLSCHLALQKRSMAELDWDAYDVELNAMWKLATLEIIRKRNEQMEIRKHGLAERLV